MDHLPGPLQPLYNTLQVPLLTHTGYDHEWGDFIGYPERENWYPRPADEWRAIFKARDADVLAFLQKWLYFGLLECALGMEIDVSLLTDEYNGYLSSQKLLQLAKESKGLNPDPEHVRSAMKYGRHMHLHLFGHSTLPETPDTKLSTEVSLGNFIERVPVEDPRDPANVIATSLLIDFLDNFLPYRWDGHLQRSVNDPKLREPKTGPLWNNLKKTGWCPSDAAAMVERFSVSGVYFMTRVCPPNPADHQSGGACTHFQCDLRQLNGATYRTKHASECAGNCGDIGINQGELARILVDEDTIPVIDASAQWSDQQRTPEIDLVTWNGSDSFVAISHVWADGLGNPSATAVPRCQMTRLSRMVQKLTGQSKALFWLDTLCVMPDSVLKNMDPTTSQRQRDAKDQAIVKMRQTYEESAYVLVLDAWIISETWSGMSDTEILMRIFCSGWNTRLWTYQEGALAKRLIFQLRDALYDLDAAIIRIAQSQDWSIMCTLQGPLVVQYNSLRGFREQVPENVERIKFLATALSFRRTSVPSDETLCLSALMGFQVQDILNVQDPNPQAPIAQAHARMKSFWAMFDQVPPAMIRFDGPTLHEDTWAWAPSSLLLSKDRPLEAYRCFLTSSTEPAVRTGSRLNIHLPGLEFYSSVPLGLEFYVEDENHVFYHFYFKLTRYKHLARPYTHNHSGHRQEELCINPQDVVGSEKLTFIFDQINDEGDILATSAHVTEVGILATMYKDPSDGSWKARKLGDATRKTLMFPQYNDEQVLRKHIQKSLQNQQDYEANRLKYPAVQNGTLLCTRGQRIPQQIWCLD